MSIKNLSLFVLLTLLFSCSEEVIDYNNQNENTESANSKLIAVRSTVNDEALLESDFIDLSADITYENDIIKSLKRYSNETDGVLISFELEGDKITKAIYSGSTDGVIDGTTFSLSYDSDGKVNVYTVTSSQFPVPLSYTLTHTANTTTMTNALSNQSLVIGYDDNGQIISLVDDFNISLKFTYENGNLIKKVLNDQSTFELEYDGQNNPFNAEHFANLNELETYGALLGGAEAAFVAENNFYNNQNNVTSMIISNYMDIDYTYNYTYEYNDNGYPTKRVLGENAAVAEFIYE